MWWVALALVGVLVGAYYLLVLTEGTFLGARVVTVLYDWTAKSYDKAKDLNWVYEMRFLGVPLGQALQQAAHPWVLDVASGTGRLPSVLTGMADWHGHVCGLDRSRRMLEQARRALRERPGVFLLQGDAHHLGFDAGAFDCVTCLEALEFMGDAKSAIEEMLRVLKPGGCLLLSNRVGPDAWLFPARLRGRGRLERYLESLGLLDVRRQRWQVHYDLVWAHKPNDAELININSSSWKGNADDKRPVVPG